MKNFINKSHWSGFTLIELLVVIGIIGVLSTVILASVNQARSRARDARRERDIKTIQTSLANYETNHNGYPLWTTGQNDRQDDLLCNPANEIYAQLIADNVMDATICDPLDSGNYIYKYQPISAGESYEIQYYLETDAISGKNPGLQVIVP